MILFYARGETFLPKFTKRASLVHPNVCHLKVATFFVCYSDDAAAERDTLLTYLSAHPFEVNNFSSRIFSVFDFRSLARFGSSLLPESINSHHIVLINFLIFPTVPLLRDGYGDVVEAASAAPLIVIMLLSINARSLSGA